MQKQLVDQYTKLTSTYKPITLVTAMLFLLSILITFLYFINETTKNMIIYIIFVLIVINVMYMNFINLNKTNKEYFNDMPNPGINELDDSDNKPFLSYTFKTAYDPLIQNISTLNYITSLGNTKWEQSIYSLEYILSRGIRSLCFNIIYMNDKPYVVSGNYNEDNKYTTNSRNYYDFYDVIKFLNDHAIKKNAKFNVPNYNDPLIIILKLHSPETENKTNNIGKIIKNIFGDHIKDSTTGSYLKRIRTNIDFGISTDSSGAQLED